MAESAETAVKTFGFIGLGLMGESMAVNLAANLASDQHMVVYDLRDSAMAEVCESSPERVAGGTSPRDVVARSVSFETRSQLRSPFLTRSRIL